VLHQFWQEPYSDLPEFVLASSVEIQMEQCSVGTLDARLQIVYGVKTPSVRRHQNIARQ
jgi:hypothetical protein